MNQCRDCKYKAAARGVTGYHGGYDDYGVSVDDAWSSCVKILHGNILIDDPKVPDVTINQYDDTALKAVVVDGSGYAARLLVKDDFGCALWEARDI